MIQVYLGYIGTGDRVMVTTFPETKLANTRVATSFVTKPKKVSSNTTSREVQVHCFMEQ
jgi:hypothetical protein